MIAPDGPITAAEPRDPRWCQPRIGLFVLVGHSNKLNLVIAYGERELTAWLLGPTRLYRRCRSSCRKPSAIP